MITLLHVEVFTKYCGDVDGLARSGSDTEKALFKKREWSLIDSFVQDIQMIEKGLTSEAYAKSIMDGIKSGSADDAVVAALVQLASQVQ